MAVFRVEKTHDYTVMSNHHLRNAALSLKAKGMLSLMLSLPEDWDYTTAGLAHICKDGVDSISSTIKELEQHGYLTRIRRRNGKGQLADAEYIIRERPVPPEQPEQPDDTARADSADESAKPTHESPTQGTSKQGTRKQVPPKQPTPKQEAPQQIPPIRENPRQVNPPRGEAVNEATKPVNPRIIQNEREKQTRDLPILENPRLDNPVQDKPILGKPPQLSTNVLSIKESSIYSINPSSRQPVPQDEGAPITQARLTDLIDTMRVYRTIIKDNIEYDVLIEQYAQDRVDEIVELMVDTVCTTSQTVRIAKNDFPTEVVKSRLLKLGMVHMQYVFECLDKNTSKVSNIRAYLLTTLYNAPTTIDAYYQAVVNYDMYGDGSRQSR